MSMNSPSWKTKTLSRAFNVYPPSESETMPSMSFPTNYTVVVMPLDAAGTTGDYECSVTLQRKYHYAQTRFFSNVVQVN